MRVFQKFKFALSLLLITTARCEKPAEDPPPAYFGRAAVRWTLNGSALTAATCQMQKISEMRIEVDSLYGYGDAVVFEAVTCDLDRYSIDMLPSGPVRIFVDALHRDSAGHTCVRFSGQSDLTTHSTYPSQPAPIALHQLTNCP